MEQDIQRRILVVDDEEPVRAVCVRMLSPLGFQVESEPDGDHAIARLEKETFDLVITDYRMPGCLNGLELGQAIKRHSPRTRIILMTAFPAVDTAVETLRMGAFDYLVKPFDREELIHCVNACFSGPSSS